MAFKVKVTEIARYYGKTRRTVQHQVLKYGGLQKMSFTDLFKVLQFYENKKKPPK